MPSINPTKAALSAAINRAIAKGSPVIVDQPTLATLKERANTARDQLDTVCRAHYPDGRWGAYRACECDQPLPDDVSTAMDAYHDALHNFFHARDGDRGFLGSRGL